MSGHATHALRLQSLAAFRPRATNAFAFAYRPCPLGFESPAPFLDNKKGPPMGPFFKVKLAESWGFEPQMPFWGILA